MIYIVSGYLFDIEFINIITTEFIKLLQVEKSLE